MTHKVIIAGPAQRVLAHQLVDKVPQGFVISFAEPKRTSEQSDKMWAMLGDISRAKPLGRRHTPDDWKAILMNACGWECQFMEGLDGRPFPQGFRSSRMTKRQMADMITYMYAFGTEHNIRWSEPNPYEEP